MTDPANRSLPPISPTRPRFWRSPSTFALTAIASHFVVSLIGNWFWAHRAQATPALFGQTLAVAFLLRANRSARHLIVVGTSCTAILSVLVGYGPQPWLLLGSVLGHLANLGATFAVIAAGDRWVQRRERDGAQRMGITGTLFWVTLLAPVVAATVSKPFGMLAGLPDGRHVFWTRWASNVIGAMSVLPVALTISVEQLRQLHKGKEPRAFYATWVFSLLTTWVAARYFPFPFVVIALPLLFAASRFFLLGTALLGLSTVLFFIGLSFRPALEFPSLHMHPMYVPFALVFTLISPLVVALLAQQRQYTMRQLAKVNERLAVEAERTRITLDSIGDAVISVNAELLVDYVNPVAERLTGYSRAEAKGLPIEQVLQLFEDGARTGAGHPVGAKAKNPLLRCMTEQRTVTIDDPLVLRSRDGSISYVGDSSAPVFSSDGNHVVGAVAVFQDVTQKQAAARALEKRAMHDALTELFNRQEFELRVRALLADSQPGTHVACFMDLDRFKVVNDTRGHAAGDVVLKAIAALLMAKTRATDVVARLGGDEFAWVLRGCPLDIALRTTTELIATIEALEIPYEDTMLGVGASIGLVEFASGEGSLETLMRHADSACYAAKRAGRGQAAVYSPNDPTPSMAE